ncbi:hypothetical protein ACRAWB_07325 [Leifsonia poae]|uniref:hypothetical protein n=1 Tax=Leifsonia poae TaxID=110933 RepID=UPI003D69ED57
MATFGTRGASGGGWLSAGSWMSGVGRPARVDRSEVYPVPVGDLERIMRAAVRRSKDLRVYELGPAGGRLYRRSFMGYGAGTVELGFLADDAGSRVDALSHLGAWAFGAGDGTESNVLTGLFRDIAAVIAEQ